MPIDRINIRPLLPALCRNATILVPNHRIRDAIISSYANTLEQSVFRTPRVYAIDIWIREFWDLNAHNGVTPCADLQLLTSNQEQFIWIEVIEKSLSQTPLLNPEETATAVNDSYRNLQQWLPRNSATGLQHFLDAPNVKAFTHWIRSYQRHCDQHQVISLVDAIIKLLDKDEFEWSGSPFLPADICLVNFFEPPLLYEDLFARLDTVTKVETIPLFDTEAIPEQSRCSFPDQIAELSACANWASKLVTSAPGEHVGIIYAADPLAQASTREQLLATLRQEPALAGLDSDLLFNSSGSRQSLMDCGLVHDAFLLLNLVNHKQSSQDLSRILQSPYLLEAESEKAARLQMEIQLRRRFTAHTTLTEFSWHLQQTERSTYAPHLAGALLNARTRLRQFPAQASAREWVLHISDWLAEFGWPGNLLSEKERSALAQWHDLLHAMAGSSMILGSLSLNAAISKLKFLCQQQNLATRFQAGNPLSIYSVTEAVGLQFDHVWLLNFSDQAWPPAAQPSPFIPYTLQRQAQIPGSDSDLQLQRAGRQFAILRSSVTRHMIASYHRSDGELECSPSSFIEAWPAATGTWWQTLTGSQRLPDTHSLPLFETVLDAAGFPLQQQETVHGGASIISNQSSCPFRAFATHRLRAEPLEPFATGLSMRDRGSALHAALELLFAEIASRAEWLALDTPQLTALLARAARHGIDYLSRRHRELMSPRFKELEQQRIQQLLQQFLELERSREDFQVMAREAAFDWQFDRLKLQLKIDRIDELGDGSLALLDYKSGKRVASSQSWLEARAEDMQLPLYYTVATAAQQQPVTALLIAHVNAEKIAYSGLVATTRVHASLKPVGLDTRISREWQELSALWQEAVQQRAAEFNAGAAQVAPLKGRKTCEYCGLQALCRIQELDSSILDDEAEREADA